MRRRTWLTGASAWAAGTLGGCRRTTGGARPRSPEIPRPATEGAAAAAPGTPPKSPCAAVPPPGPGDFARRIERVRRHMASFDQAAYLCEPGPAMTYLSGVSWGRSERPFLLVVPRMGTPTWIVPAFEAARAAERLGGDARVLTWQEHESPFARLADILPAGRSVALDPNMRLFVARGVRAAWNLSPRPGPDPVAAARRLKDAHELAILECANRATKQAIAQVAPRLTPGMTQEQIAHLMGEAQRALGLTDVWVLALVGPSAAFPHGSKAPRAAREGDLVLVDTGGALHGYHSDITRTFALGDPARISAELRRAYEAVRAAQAAAREAMTPGRPCGEVDAVARRTLAAAGYDGDYGHMTHRLGHGIGLQGHEGPYLVGDNPLPLAPGMVTSVEPGIYVPGHFGVRLEDIVAVQETGPAAPFGPLPGPLDDPLAGHLEG